MTIQSPTLKRADGTQQQPSLNQFWVKSQGFSLRCAKVQLLDQLPLAERLFASILRGDEEASRDLLLRYGNLSGMLQRFRALVKKEGFAGLVLERVFTMDIANELAHDSTLAKLSQMARADTASHHSAEQRFARLLQLLAEHRHQVLWVKGVHLSRTVYPRPHLRQYGDVDAIVHPAQIKSFLSTLEEAGFGRFGGAAYSNQCGVGPLGRLSDLFIAPYSDWVPVSVLTLQHRKQWSDWPLIDLKTAPLDRGLQAIELDRIFSQAESAHCVGEQYFAPNPSDHLMIVLRNLDKDRFENWKSLMDVDLLSRALSKTPGAWQAFVRSCRVESIRTSAWTGLSMAVNRLSTPVPPTVLEQLAPSSKWQRYTSFTVSPCFIWNATSLPMLLCNAWVSEDRKRKLAMLAKTLFPPAEFLSNYYRQGRTLWWHSSALLLSLHWLVFFLPGGAVRRTFGRALWRFNSDG